MMPIYIKKKTGEVIKLNESGLGDIFVRTAHKNFLFDDELTGFYWTVIARYDDSREVELMSYKEASEGRDRADRFVNDLYEKLMSRQTKP